MTCANYYKPVYIKIPLIRLIKRHPLLGGSEKMKKRMKECNSKQHNELQMKNSLSHTVFCFYIAFMSINFFSGWKCFLSFFRWILCSSWWSVKDWTVYVMNMQMFPDQPFVHWPLPISIYAIEAMFHWSCQCSAVSIPANAVKSITII